MSVVCVSGLVDSISFLIVRDEESKYIAQIFEAQDTKTDSFEQYLQAESWVKDYINEQKRIRDEADRFI